MHQASTVVTGAIDALAASKESTEAHRYSKLCDFTNLDLLTSFYFETEGLGGPRLTSLAYGYSRDHRGDRSQVVIGPLVNGDGIPIAHHVFSGNTSDVSTLASIMEDLQQRFGVAGSPLSRIEALISEDKLALVEGHGFDHVLATRLHHDEDVAAVLEKANAPDSSWVAVPEARSFCAEVAQYGRRFVVVFSPTRYLRDRARHRALCTKVEDGLIATLPQGLLK
jgi:hypothetical protein